MSFDLPASVVLVDEPISVKDKRVGEVLHDIPNPRRKHLCQICIKCASPQLESLMPINMKSLVGDYCKACKIPPKD